MTRSFLALALLLGGCVQSHRAAPALQYDDIVYAGPSGTEWPARSVPLPQTAARYEMLSVPQVHVVELNPTGAETLVFVHGLGSYLKLWRHQLDTFAASGYRVVAFDMVGYGKSDKPASFPYTMEAMADVVLEVMAHLGLERPVVVGHSMGGQTALSLAIRHPEALSALVLAAPAGFEHFSRRERAWFKRVFSSALVRSADEQAIWGNIRYNNFSRWQDRHAWLVEERVRTAKSDAFSAYAYANVRSVHGLLDNDFVRQNLHRVSVPTLIVYGEDDRLIPNPYLHGGRARDVMIYGATHIRDVLLFPLPGCGHMVQMDCSSRFNGATLAFLQTQAARRRQVATSTPTAANAQ